MRTLKSLETTDLSFLVVIFFVLAVVITRMLIFLKEFRIPELK